MNRPETALGILRNRANEVNELATAYNTIVGYIEKLEAAESQLGGDFDTLGKNYSYAREVNTQLIAENKRLKDELGRLAKVKKFLDGLAEELRNNTLPEIIDAIKPPVDPAKETDGQSDSRTAAKEQAA